MKRTKGERRSVTYWRELIAEQEESGITQQSFCEARNIPLSSFQSAKKRVSESPFFEVRPPASISTAAGSWEAEVNFPNGITVIVRG